VWEASREFISGPWSVGIRFDRSDTADAFDQAFHELARLHQAGLTPAVGVRSERGIGSTLFFGHLALARAADQAALWESLAWFVASLRDGVAGQVDLTRLRVLVGSAGAVLLAAERPLLLGARAWRHAGVVELPLWAVQTTPTGIVLPRAHPSHLGEFGTALAGAALPVVGVVARSGPEELRQDALNRLGQHLDTSSGQMLFSDLQHRSRVRSAGRRARLIEHVLELLEL